MNGLHLKDMQDNPAERKMPTPAWEGGPEEDVFRKNMGESSFFTQFQALIFRNLSIKKRDKRKTLTVSLCVM